MERYSLQLTILFILLMVCSEAWHDYHSGRRSYRFNDTLSNLSAGMVSIVTNASIHALLLFAYLGVYEQFRLLSTVAFWWQFILGFWLYEFLYYWKHRFGHEVNFLWGAHQVHHQSEEMNFSTATRSSAIIQLWSIPFHLIMALIGISPLVFYLVQLIGHSYQFFLHTERRIQLPFWIHLFFNTPAHHRVHHARQEEYLDKNYGGVLIVFDRMFGSFIAEREQPVYGMLHPLDSWNPVRANLWYYGRMFRWLSRVRSWRDGWKVVFGRPDNLPAYLVWEEGEGANITRGLLDKYDPPIEGTRFKYYIVGQFIQAVLLTIWLVGVYHDMALILIIFVSILVCWLFAQVGRLMEIEQSRARGIELFKHPILLIGGIFITYYGEFVMLGWVWAACGLSILSFLAQYFLLDRASSFYHKQSEF